jgi:hypothetical protein
MSENWPTRERDLETARSIMEKYAIEFETDSLGLFEIVVDTAEKSMNFRLSGWVMHLATHFVACYGEEQGDFITRQIVSRCIVQGQTLH